MSQEGIKQIDNSETIEALRLILECQQNRPVTYQEALDVGDSLITFYETLAAEGQPDE